MIDYKIKELERLLEEKRKKESKINLKSKKGKGFKILAFLTLADFLQKSPKNKRRKHTIKYDVLAKILKKFVTNSRAGYFFECHPSNLRILQVPKMAF